MTFIDLFRAFRNHKFHLWTQRHLAQHNHTMELRMFGQKLVMTDDPENIKAILETQVLRPLTAIQHILELGGLIIGA